MLREEGTEESDLIQKQDQTDETKKEDETGASTIVQLNVISPKGTLSSKVDFFKKSVKARYTNFCWGIGCRSNLPVINYVNTQIYDQIKAVLPISLYLILFRALVFQRGVSDFASVFFGLWAVVFGLALFMEGLKLALMPLGELIGNKLPRKLSLWKVLIIAFLLGVLVTLAEPAIGALATLGSLVQPEKAPYLYFLLNNWNLLLMLFVGLGVGLAAVVGLLRFTRDWSLKPLIYSALVLTISLTTYCMWGDESLRSIIGLAWDCGAVTTGPVTVPIILAIGIGVTSFTNQGKEASPLSGFGVVTLASLYPIVAVEGLGVIVSILKTDEEVLAAVKDLQLSNSHPWYYESPFREAIFAVRAIAPLVTFIGIVLKLILKEPWPKITLKEMISGRVGQPEEETPDETSADGANAEEVKEPRWKYTVFFAGLCCAQLGMIVFNLGLTFGLSALGNQAGLILPSAYLHVEEEPESPFYPAAAGLAIIGIFGFLLGFLATIAEPALNVLGMKVEMLTNGEFSKNLLIYSVSFGVGSGITLGVLKVVLHWDLIWMIYIGYIIAVSATIPSDEAFVNVAWDSAGVTTGPVTVPFVLSLGLSLGNAAGASDGFGILTLASIGPIISVLCTGLFTKFYKRYFKKIIPTPKGKTPNAVEMDQI